MKVELRIAADPEDLKGPIKEVKCITLHNGPIQEGHFFVIQLPAENGTAHFVRITP